MRVRQNRAFARVAVSLLVRNHHLARITHVHSHQRDLETGDVGTQHRAVNTVGRRRQQVGGVDADTSARKQLILHVDSRRNQRRQVALRRRTVGKVMNQHIGVAVKLRYHLLIVRCAVGICARLLLRSATHCFHCANPHSTPTRRAPGRVCTPRAPEGTTPIKEIFSLKFYFWSSLSRFIGLELRFLFKSEHSGNYVAWEFHHGIVVFVDSVCVVHTRR